MDWIYVMNYFYGSETHAGDEGGTDIYRGEKRVLPCRGPKLAQY